MTRPSETAYRAVELGLVCFAPHGESFTARKGNCTRYLIDTRGAVADLDLRALIVDGLRDCLDHRFSEAETIAGLAKAGTAWAMWLAWEAGLPAANVIVDGPRTSGLQRQIEGVVKGKRCLILDNFVRTGESIRRSREILVDAGGEVIGALTVVSTASAVAGTTLHQVWKLDDLISAARDIGRIDKLTYDLIMEDEIQCLI